MTKVFADTGYWIALLKPGDEHQDKARRVVNELVKPVQYVTTEMVLAEFLNALAKYGAGIRAAAIRLVDELRERRDTLIIEQTHPQFEAALDVYRLYADKDWALTDCASYAAMRAEGLDLALAHDHHFEQMGFRALLRES